MLVQAYSAPAPGGREAQDPSPPSPASPISDTDMEGGGSDDGPSTSSTSLDHPEPPSKPQPATSCDPSPPLPSPPRRASHLGSSLPSSATPPRPAPPLAPSMSPRPPGTAPGAAINPLFALGEQVRTGAIDPSLVRFQKGGVVVREGPPPRMTSRAGTPRSAADGEDSPGWTDWLHERVHPRRHQRGGGAAAGPTGNGNSVGEDDPGCSHRPGKPLALPSGSAGGDGDGDGEPEHVDDFRDQEDQQDHVDEARIKLREWRSDFQDRLEDNGLRAPSPWRRGADGGPASGVGRAADQLEPRLAAMLDRQPGQGQSLAEQEEDGRPELRHAPSSTLGGSSSFHSAVSDTDGDALFVPERSESPVSYASTGDLHQPVASTSSAPPPPPVPPASTAVDPLDRSPVVFAPGFVATNSRLVPLPDQPQHRTVTAQTSHRSLSSSPPRLHAIPAHQVAAPSAEARPLHLQPPASPRSARQRHAAAGAPPSPRATGSQHLQPPPAPSLASRTPSPPIRRSQTTDSPPSLAAPFAMVDGPPALGPPVSGSRRFSSASSGMRLPLSAAQRSQSFSFAPSYDPSSPPASPLPLSPNGTVILDDVDASIAAQAEAIRRQRQEKRAEAEKAAAAAAAAARSTHSLAPPGSPLSPPSSSPGGLKRRTARMGSGGSERDPQPRSASGPAATGANGSTAGPGEDGAVASTSAHAHGAHHHPGPGARQRSRGPGAGLDGHPGGGEDELGAGVLVGNLIGQDHANYVLMYNMLTGIRIGVRWFSPACCDEADSLTTFILSLCTGLAVPGQGCTTPHRRRLHCTPQVQL